jgi:hypothetical protein
VNEPALQGAIEDPTAAGHQAIAVTCEVADEKQVAAISTAICPGTIETRVADRSIKRRGGDSNPRWTERPIPVFETGAFNRSATSPRCARTS